MVAALAEDMILLLVVPLVASSAFALVVRRLGFSAIAGYILGGVLVGPVLHLVDTQSPLLSFLSELGIILISFEIGLVVKLDFLSRGGLRSGGIVAVEVVIVSLLTIFFGTILGLQWGDVLVLVFLSVNTSTAITFTMLEERGLDDPNTKATILGVGAFEDIIAIVGLSIFPVIAAAERPDPLSLVQLLVGILLSVIFMVYLGLRFLGRPLRWAAGKESEIFLALSLGVVLVYAYLGFLSGLSTAFGAFIAGLVVSNLGVQKEVEERMRSLRDLSSLIFFSSIGASLPLVSDPTLIAAAIAVSLLVVIVKFVGFSLSSWVMGVKLEQAFKLGLFMLAISEFGVIVARNAVDSGLASQNLYLVSVIALAGSAIMSSGFVMFEDTLPDRLASLFPEALRWRMESFFRIIGDALGKKAMVLSEIRSVLWELMRRIAIILLVVSVGNLTLTYVTPLLAPPTLRFYVDVAVSGFTILIVLTIGWGMRGVYRRLFWEIASRMERSQRGINEYMESFLYVATLSILVSTILLVSFPLILRTFGGVLGELGSGFVVLVVIILMFLLARSAAVRTAERLEETFQLS